MIKTTAPDGSVSSVSSDIKNNTIIQEKPNGTKTKYVYTKLGNLSKVYITNDSGAWIMSAQRTYDSALRPSSEYVYKDYNGTTATDYVKTAYTYVAMPDSRVQKVKSTDKSGKTIQEISYEYDKKVLLSAAHNSDTSGLYYNTAIQTVTGDSTITPYKVKTYTDIRGLTYK